MEREKSPLEYLRRMGKRYSKKYRRTMVVLHRHREKMAAIQEAENRRNLEICRQMQPWLCGVEAV